MDSQVFFHHKILILKIEHMVVLLQNGNRKSNIYKKEPKIHISQLY